MEKKKIKQKKMPFYKKAICVGIMVTVVIYCFPELQEKLINTLEMIKNEWRKQR